MSYGDLETSVQSGAPVEFYRFQVGKDIGFPPSPAAPGALVRILSVAPGDWSIVRDTGQTSIGSCPPTSPDSAICGPYPQYDFPAGLTVWGAFHGGIGGANAFFYGRVDLSAWTAPNHQYVVRFLARQLGGQSLDVIGVRLFNDATGTTPTSSSSWAYLDHTITSGPAGELYADVGHFAMQIGAAAIMGAAFVALYDAEAPAGPSDPGGLPLFVYNFTSADVPLVFKGETYEPAIITRGPLQYSDDESRSMDMVIEVPRDHAIVGIAGRPAPAAPVGCTIYRAHRQDLASFATPLIAQVTRCEKAGPTARLTLTPVTSLFAKKLPIVVTQKKCPLQVYGLICQASRTGHEFAGLTVNAVSGREITVSGAAALAAADPTRFTEGVLTAADGSQSSIESFDATSATPDVVRLYAANPSVTVGSTVTLLDGCTKELTVCHNRFGNEVHFLGEPVMTSRNPGTGAGLN